MKKIFMIVLSAVLMVTFVSCGKDGNNNETEKYDYDSVLTETGADLDIGSVIID